MTATQIDGAPSADTWAASQRGVAESAHSSLSGSHGMPAVPLDRVRTVQ